MKKVHLIYFSPSGTTKRTLTAIGDGMDHARIIHHDMLKAENRKKKLSFSSDELVVFGILTGVKMFGPVKEILGCLKGDNTPFVGVTMFGNGSYGSALKDLKRHIEKQGFKMVAGAGFIGQYSLSSKIATGRPDASDVKKANIFGKDIYEKVFIKKDLTMTSKLKIDWPNHYGSFVNYMMTLIPSYMPMTGITMPKFINNRVIKDSCIACKKCERNCPMGAINIDKNEVDINKCIGCNGCTNGCPKNAIIPESKMLDKMIKAKESVDSERREPVIFF